MSNPTQTGWNIGIPPYLAPSLNWLQRAALRIAGVDLSQNVSPQVAPPPPDVPQATNDTPYIARQMSYWDAAFMSLNRERVARYTEYDEMDYGDVASQLDTIRDAVLISNDNRERAFKVEARGNRKIDSLIQDLIQRTGIQFDIYTYLRECLKYGDVPIALWFDTDYNIVSTQNIDAAYMRRYTDAYGRLLGGSEKHHFDGQTINLPRAYRQIDWQAGSVGDDSNPINGWESWQMLWLMWRRNKRFRYSQGSYIEDMRRDWMKLRHMEASMVVARATRAYPRRIYTLDTTGLDNKGKQSAILQFKQALGLTEVYNTDSNGNMVAGAQVKNPLDVDSDIFIATSYRVTPDGKMVPALNDVKLEDPRIAGIENMPDIEYMRGKQYRRLPPDLMGVQRNNTDITSQDIAAARMFQYCADILEWQLIRPIITLQALLKGYTIDNDEITVTFNNDTVKSSWRHSDADFRRSMANKNDLSAGLATVKGLLQDQERLTDVEVAQHFAQLDTEKKLRDVGTLPPLDGGTKTGNAEPPNLDQARKGMNSA